MYCEGNLPGTGGGGGPPPPPQCPPAAGEENYSTRNPITVTKAKGRLIINVLAPPEDPGDGGDDPNNPNPQPSPCSVPVVADIINKVKDTCLHNMVQAAIDRNIQYNLTQSINSIFGAGSNFNLTFLDGSIPNSNGKIVDAETDVVGQPTYYLLGARKIYHTMDINITLNSNSLPNTTQEYITVSILHETLHAYFKQTGQIDDHDEMVNNYIPWFESALRAIYPNIPPADLEALAYGGLMDSMAFSLSEKDAFASLYNMTNRLYIDGTKGQNVTNYSYLI